MKTAENRRGDDAVAVANPMARRHRREVGQQILVFDDLRVDRTGRIAKFGGLMDRHNGREGNVRLINGTPEPEVTIAAGQIECWRIVNASSARYVRLSLGGRPFRIIGTDGGPDRSAGGPPRKCSSRPATAWSLPSVRSRPRARCSPSRSCRITGWPAGRASSASGRSG
jgi:hypothetical protein